ncbi:MAG: hypothetical protein WKF30_02035 [Pyrinomonadaceae bacterium]
MRIGIDAISLAQSKTGIGHYTFELARGLADLSPADDFELLAPVPTLDLTDGGALELPRNLRVVQARINRLRKHWWSIGLPLYLSEAGYALFHGTNYNVPLWNRCRTVVSIHDLSLLLHPETHEEHLVRRAPPHADHGARRDDDHYAFRSREARIVRALQHIPRKSRRDARSGPAQLSARHARRNQRGATATKD